MMKCSAITTAVFCLLYHANVLSTSEEACGHGSDSANSINLFVSSKRNLTGNWVTNFALGKDDSSNDVPNEVSLDLWQKVTACRGKKTFHIHGVLSEALPHPLEDQMKIVKEKLLFHTKCGSNAAVLNDGHTIQKMNLDKDGNGVAFTNRPLKNNEILEITLERKHNKFDHSLGIGLTTLSPNAASSPTHINSILNMSWALYERGVFHNGKEILANYGKNIPSLKVGERVGVMRSNTGSLHYFMNGEDQGPAASNIPYPVFGVVELRGHAIKLTIVDS